VAGINGTDVRIEEKTDGIYLYLKISNDFTVKENKIISSSDFGEAMVPSAIFDNPDGTPIIINTDYFNKYRIWNRNTAGPFANLTLGDNRIKFWPK